jgi:hypothetical protein
VQSENRHLREKFQAVHNIITQLCSARDLDEEGLQQAREVYEQANAEIKGLAPPYEQRELQYFLLKPLLQGYVNLRKFVEAVELFATWIPNSETNDLLKLVLAEGEMDKHHSVATLELIAGLCYAFIVFDHWRRLYEELKFGPWLGQDARRRYQLSQISALATISKPDEAFSMFQASYKQLAELYQDQELQQSWPAFREASDVWKQHAEVIKLAEQYRNKELRQIFLYGIAFCCSESILDYSKIGKVDEARSAYESLKYLVETHGEQQAELVRAQAKGAGNLVYAFVTANRPDEARMVYEELCQLAEELENEPTLRVWQATRASDVLYAYATANRPDEARMVYEELCQLAEDFSTEPKLRIWQAEGAGDLVYAFCKTGRYVDAKEIFQELEALRKSDDNFGLAIEKRKIDGVPVMDRLRQLLQKGLAS